MVIDKPKDKIQVIDIVKNAKLKKLKEKIEDASIRKECIWLLEGDHQGEVIDATFFNGQLKVSCCEYHLEHHIAVMSLAHSPTWKEMHGEAYVDAALALTHDDCVAAANKYGLLTVML